MHFAAFARAGCAAPFFHISVELFKHPAAPRLIISITTQCNTLRRFLCVWVCFPKSHKSTFRSLRSSSCRWKHSSTFGVKKGGAPAALLALRKHFLSPWCDSPCVSFRTFQVKVAQRWGFRSDPTACRRGRRPLLGVWNCDCFDV